MNTVKKVGNWLYRFNRATDSFVLLLLAVFIFKSFIITFYSVPTGSMETTMLVGEGFVADKFTIRLGYLKRGDIISFNDPLFKYGESFVTRTWQQHIGTPPSWLIASVDWWQRYIDIVWGPSSWTKRLIGLPGDHIRGTVEDGHTVVYRNGTKLEESYVNKYPLLAVWLGELPPGGQSTSSTNVEMINSNMCKCTLEFRYRSYNPSYAYDKQPFYRIDPYKIVSSAWLNHLRQVSPLEPGTPMRNGRDEYDLVLKDNEYWAMGDNRLGSDDSRIWGPLKAHLIHGKIVFRLWSVDTSESWLIMDILKHPIDIWSRIRWSRFLQWLS